MSDSDAAFKGNDRNEDQNIQKLLTDDNAVLEPVKFNYHHALGVIDTFVKNLERILSKGLLRTRAHIGSVCYQKLLNNTTTHQTNH